MHPAGPFIEAGVDGIQLQVVTRRRRWLVFMNAKENGIIARKSDL
jgi:hypothetical protein